MDYKFINTEYLESVSGGDKDITREIVSMFKTQAVEIHGEMELRFTQKEYLILGQLAHKAKSSVAIMGMDNLAAMLKTLELSSREGKDTGLYESYIKRFKFETDAAATELDDFVRKF